MRFERCRRCTRTPVRQFGQDDDARLSEQLLCAWSGCEAGVMASDHAIDVLARRLAETQG